MTARFWIGETVRLRLAFVDPETGIAVTPGGVTVEARKPDTTTANYAATVAGNMATADIAADQAGLWWARATASTPSPSAVEVSFTVLASNVP